MTEKYTQRREGRFVRLKETISSNSSGQTFVPLLGPGRLSLPFLLFDSPTARVQVKGLLVQPDR